MAENPTDDITFLISMFESVRFLLRIFVLSTCVLSSYWMVEVASDMAGEFFSLNVLLSCWKYTYGGDPADDIRSQFCYFKMY